MTRELRWVTQENYWAYRYGRQGIFLDVRGALRAVVEQVLRDSGH
ncbi:MAG TPA: hypothetical protein VES70_25880 [Pseudomonas sp.]|nr:hypothetical protein [Pseudomonas sp.]